MLQELHGSLLVETTLVANTLIECAKFLSLLALNLQSNATLFVLIWQSRSEKI
jgi:hypothetical protein